MKRAVLLIAALLVVSSAVSAQYASVFHVDMKRNVQPSDKPQTYWIRVRIKTNLPQDPKYKNLRVTLLLARFDPHWKSTTVPGVGPIRVNPGLLVLIDSTAKTKLIYRNILSNRGDDWLVSVTLPPIPPELVGHAFSVMLLCREASGPPKYSTSSGSNGPDDVHLLIVPR